MTDGFFASHSLCSFLRKKGVLKPLHVPALSQDPSGPFVVAPLSRCDLVRLPFHADGNAAAVSAAGAFDTGRCAYDADEANGGGSHERADGD